MARTVITNQEARDLDHEELLNRIEAMLDEYAPPTAPEPPEQRVARLSRTIEEVPEIYRWLLQLWSWMDHWTDATNDMFGRTDRRYKALRQRRDLFEKMASAAKMRYESASRQITLMQGFDETGMPRSRRV